MATLLRIGTKVRTIDWGARVHGRAPDKPEAIGTIQDHHRPYGRQSKDRAPPYYVTFETGETAWYDASEVERLQGARSSHPTDKQPHATRKTPPAQLEREIAEALTRPAGSGSTNPFEDARAEHDLIQREVDAASEVLQTFPRSPMGGVRDDVRATLEFQAANARFQKAFARLRAFNTIYVKRFAKELRTERARRYGQGR
jgi:hypothetical protein